MDILQLLASIDHMLTPEEVSKVTGLSVKTIYRQTKGRRLKVAAFGSSFRYNPSDVAEWIRSRTK